MYFNENKENTNIDKEFEKHEEVDHEKFKKILFIVGGIALFIILLIIIVFIAKNNRKYFIVLEGDENITIYQGATYNEPGYEGFDNRKNDLTGQVVVKSNLDTESIGTYTIIYSLNKTSATRTITVVEKPAVTTLIYLSGDKNMTLSVGEEYIEPGYRATDALTGDITDKVMVTGTVDTSKKGIYRKIYSVIDSEGTTITEVRTVTVE